METVNFASSLGWRLIKPMFIHLLAPKSLVPIPGIKTKTNKAIVT